MKNPYLLLFRLIWEFPQVFIALVTMFITIIPFSKGFAEIGNSIIMYTKGGWGAICLGPFIFISEGSKGHSEKHEYGHSIQSMILGPLYLFIIGLPSLLHATYFLLYYKIKKRRPKKNYYSFFTEKWADKLGGVTRT
jgi:hypothetical protein